MKLDSHHDAGRVIRPGRKLLLGTIVSVALVALTACGKREAPFPSSSPPHPTTFGGSASTADLRLSHLPEPAPPGSM